MNVVDLIERKRDGGVLSAAEIEWLIRGFTSGAVADYQMAALAMAIFLNGLDHDELAAWTSAMLHSGSVLDFGSLPLKKVDKHSTGGVGDKVSIPLGPMVAACGVAIPMMSGRGLGHTGGTLDKLESIPGFRTRLDPAEFESILGRTNLVLAGQSESLVPADRLLYALRDATGTVPSIPLIASSIMSKKLAEGLDALVLDVKFGSGAFMRQLDSARVLAQTMVDIGHSHGVDTVALLTDMNTPLGREVGNANEIRESIDVLRGGGPHDLVELTYALGAEMLVLAGVSPDNDIARRGLRRVIENGEAFALFKEVVVAQGGDPAFVDHPERLPMANDSHTITAPDAGYILTADAHKIGMAAMRLGAGRARKEDTVDHGVGITVLAKPGDVVETGQPLARLTYRQPARVHDALGVIEGAWTIGDRPVAPSPIVVGRIES